MAYSYARRDELAKEQGFASYYDKRRTLEFANAPRSSFVKVIGHKAGGQRHANYEDARTYYQAFKTGPKNDYRIYRNTRGEIVTRGGRGARAKWLIRAGYVSSYEEWLELYPNGKRG